MPPSALRAIISNMKWSDLPPERKRRYKETQRQKRLAEIAADPQGFKERESAKNLKARQNRIARVGSEGEHSRMSVAWFKHKYGITPDEADAMRMAVGNRCELCQVHHDELKPAKYKRRLHVDHCHDTGKIRGILCFTCNMMLGFAKNSPDRLRKAALYLEERH